jgi:dihydrodipicolinate synthase/N-acetylneuraminate lyase
VVELIGSYGCGALISIEEWKKVTEITMKAAAGKLSVY